MRTIQIVLSYSWTQPSGHGQSCERAATSRVTAVARTAKDMEVAATILEVVEILPHGMRFSDRTETDGDEVAFATGCDRDILGDEVADWVGAGDWGLDKEGERCVGCLIEATVRRTGCWWDGR